MIGIYVHIPFCRTRCPYCDFHRWPIHGPVPDDFIQSLCDEIAAFEDVHHAPSDSLREGLAPANGVFERASTNPPLKGGRGDVGQLQQPAALQERTSPLPPFKGGFHEQTSPDLRTRVLSIFFGGGTPSLLSPAALGRILEALHNRFLFVDPEITIEANPDDVTNDLAQAWSDLGINRVSLGVQSFDDRVLGYLGRRHDAATATRACEIVAGLFENWGMDLMFGAHPVDSWQATLHKCVACAPKHVAAYGLTYEHGTPFEQRQADTVDDDTWLALYRQADAVLAGYDHYEISNFARPGYECRHNLVYWRNEQYAGFGPGAYSFLNGVRARNVLAIDEYLAHPGAKSEALLLTDHEIRVETVIQHLRLKRGLSKRDYATRFGSSVRADFGPQLDLLLSRDLIIEDADSIRPTSRGFELNNEIGLVLV